MGKFKESFLSFAPVIVLGILMYVFTGFMDAELLANWFLGSFFAIIGLFLFLRGVDYFLTPLGDLFGTRLPLAPNLLVMLVIVFIIGVAVNASDPSLAVLSEHINSINAQQALALEGTVGNVVEVTKTIPSKVVIMAVVLGIGLFLCVAILRIIFSWPAAWVLGIGYGSTLILGCFVPPTFLALAFDSGGVATGPLTVPFMLAIGIGFVSVLNRDDSVSDSFGLLGLVALGPIFSLMLLGIFWR